MLFLNARHLYQSTLARSLLLGFCVLTAGCSFEVNSTDDRADASPGDGVCADRLGLCTLRAAVTEAHESLGTYRIIIPEGTYELTLPVSDPNGGALKILSNMQLQGAGPAQTIIDAGGRYGVIQVEAGSDVALNYLQITDGDNQAGGGLRVNAGDVSLYNVHIHDNHSVTGGAGLYVLPGASVEGDLVEFTDNNADGAFGGGAWNQGELRLRQSLFANNDSNRAGALHNSPDTILNLYNVTMSGNTAHSPTRGTGGIHQNGFAVLRNVTITNNVGRQSSGNIAAGGISTVAGRITVLKNTLIANNTKIINSGGSPVPSDCTGAVSSDSRYNLMEDHAECTLPALTTSWVLDQDPNLSALGNNGGATRTHALLFSSPAIDAGFPFPPGSPAADACRALDQRGVPRPQKLSSNSGEALCDIGAYEAGNLPAFIQGFMLVDADSDSDIAPLRHGDILVLDNLPPNLSIRAISNGAPGSVRFDYDATINIRTENVAPYAIGGDTAGDYLPFALTGGTHRLSATPYALADADGAGGGGIAIEFQVIAP